MKKYCVQIVEIYRQDIFIEAENEEQAIKKVQNGEGIEGELHYQSTPGPDEWGMDKYLAV